MSNQPTYPYGIDWSAAAEEWQDVPLMYECFSYIAGNQISIDEVLNRLAALLQQLVDNLQREYVLRLIVYITLLATPGIPGLP